MILVTGATGQLGRAVTETLLKKTSADQVAALVRDEGKAAALRESGIRLRIGSYDDAGSLDRAMQGIQKVLLIAGTDEDRRVEQHRNVVEAAKKAGVQAIAYTSRTLKDRNTLENKLMLGHFETEELIVRSGLDYTIFRNVLYMDVLPQFLGERVFEDGIRLPTGPGRVPFALRRDMGEAIANELLSEGGGKRLYKFTGREAYSFADVAAALSELTGKAVAYQPVEKSDFEAQLKARGLPDVVARRIVGFMMDIKNGQEDEVTSDLEDWLGRPPTPLREGLKLLFKR
ncbi:SDR family oxidoreductase [Deinococcus alpinitundrae]|uniref:SDR family oxidoreductase n=1 Tax=Deinococcus alpinitundrae TaxID=468913 RepID=UPI00137AFF2B|nr:SDR family oxidoreductase [Deinococcus alpinitundrae]